MDKASKALRRSSVRLKSMGCGHRDLNMVISQLRDVRSSAKAFMVAQNTASQDLLKWSMSNENHLIQDTFTLLAELNSLWTEVQKEFTEHLKEFSYQFEMILDGEHHVDHTRNHMAACEQMELRIKKELKKSSKKMDAHEEIQLLESKLSQAERSRELAQIDVVDRVQENEAVKMIRIKEGLLKLSESYLELAHKCHVIHEAHRDIACEIPDIQDKNIHEIKNPGFVIAKQAVSRAKNQVRQYRCRSHSLLPCAPVHEEPPPPYSENVNHSLDVHSSRNSLDTRSPGSHVVNISGNSSTSMRHSTNPFDEDTSINRYPTYHDHDTLNETGVNQHTDYEEELAGAVGRMRS